MNHGNIYTVNIFSLPLFDFHKISGEIQSIYKYQVSTSRAVLILSRYS